MGFFGAGVDVAQNDQLGLGRCRCFDDGLREFDRPAAISGDLIPSDAGVHGNDGQFLRLRIRLQNAEIRDDPGRAAGRQSEPLPMIAAFPCPMEVTKGSLSTKPRFVSAMVMKMRPQLEAISGAPPPPGRRTLGWS